MAESARKFYGNLKLFFAAVLGALLLLFAIQNTAQVELSVLFWTFEARRIVVISLSFLVGLAIGWLLKAHRTKA